VFVVVAPDGSVPTRPLFTVDERRGTIRTAQRLDRDALCRRTVDHDSCYIRFDVAVRPMTHFRIVRVRVAIIDVNDNAPVFPRSSFSVALPESAAVGTSVPIPAAHDADSGQVVHIESGRSRRRLGAQRARALRHRDVIVVGGGGAVQTGGTQSERRETRVDVSAGPRDTRPLRAVDRCQGLRRPGSLWVNPGSPSSPIEI